MSPADGEFLIGVDVHTGISVYGHWEGATLHVTRGEKDGKSVEVSPGSLTIDIRPFIHEESK
jgi:hypothetical protein